MSSAEHLLGYENSKGRNQVRYLLDEGFPVISRQLSADAAKDGPYRRGLVRATEPYRWNVAAWIARCNSDLIMLHDGQSLFHSTRDPWVFDRKTPDERRIWYGIGVHTPDRRTGDGVQRLSVSDGDVCLLYERTQGTKKRHEACLMIGILDVSEDFTAALLMNEYSSWAVHPKTQESSPVTVRYDIQRLISREYDRDSMKNLPEWVRIANQLVYTVGKGLFPGDYFQPPDIPQSPDRPSAPIPPGWSPFGRFGSKDPVPV